MTKEGALKILRTLSTNYPNFLSGRDPSMMVELWMKAFRDVPDETIAAAALAYMYTETSGFPPTIGQISQKIRLAQTTDELDEVSAWALVSKALKNSSYNYMEEWEKLPETIQKTIGDPKLLQEWARMDSSETQTVIASNFQRSYRARAAHVREIQAIPAHVRNVLLEQTKNLFAMPDEYKENEPEKLAISGEICNNNISEVVKDGQG